MNPFSYTSIKVIHDQKVQEALERHSIDPGHTTPRQGVGVRQILKKFLARFNSHPAENRQECLPECARSSSGTS